MGLTLTEHNVNLPQDRTEKYWEGKSLQVLLSLHLEHAEEALHKKLGPHYLNFLPQLIACRAFDSAC